MTDYCKTCRKELSEGGLLFWKKNLPLKCSRCGNEGCQRCFLKDPVKKGRILQLELLDLSKPGDFERYQSDMIKFGPKDNGLVGVPEKGYHYFCGPECAAEKIFFNDYFILESNEMLRSKEFDLRLKELERERDESYVHLSRVLYDNFEEREISKIMFYRDRNIGTIRKMMTIGYNFLLGEPELEVYDREKLLPLFRKLGRGLSDTELFFFLNESFWYPTRVRPIQDGKLKSAKDWRTVTKVLFRSKWGKDNYPFGYRIYHGYHGDGRADFLHNRTLQSLAYDSWVCNYLMLGQSALLDDIRDLLVKLLEHEIEIIGRKDR